MEVVGEIEQLPWPVMTDKGPGLLTDTGCYTFTGHGCEFAEVLYPLSVWCPNFVETEGSSCGNMLSPCFCKRNDRILCQLWLAAQRLAKFVGIEAAEAMLDEEEYE